MVRLSKSAHKIEGQPMFQVLDKVHKLEAQGEHVIHFEIGDPDFSTPDHIIDEAVKALRNGETHYTSSMGLPEMRKQVQDDVLRFKGFKPDYDQVLITPGANAIVYLTIKCLVDEGEEVIVPDPGFPTYKSAIKLCNVHPIYIPLKEENKFRMNPDDVRRAITPKTKLMIINSPSNPTGAVITPKELDEFYQIAKEHDMYILSDEIYSRMNYGETPYHSPAFHDHCKERTIVLEGFSKSYAMTGWRLGVAIGPPMLMEKMGLLIETINSCVQPFLQRAAMAAWGGPQDCVHDMMATYKERRDVLVAGLNDLPGVSCVKNEGAFYVFPNVTGTGMTSDEFTDFMLDKARVSVLPGHNFGKSGTGFVRLTYATSLENIKEGLSRMHEALKNR